MFEGFDDGFAAVNGIEVFYRTGGQGPPLLLLHGFPQTGAMWSKVAPSLSQRFRLVIPDLRGYGRSAKPAGSVNHSAYAKKTMARDMIELMDHLGHGPFQVAGHDRGARVAHRMLRDVPRRIERAAVLDIIPTREVYRRTDQHLARAYYHWFFYIQPAPMPERLIGGEPDYYLDFTLGEGLGQGLHCYAPEALAEYHAAFRDPACVHAICEDYRAGAAIDLEHDDADHGTKIACPLLVLWGTNGVVGRLYGDIPGIWLDYATNVTGKAIKSGHFLAEENPHETLDALVNFFDAG